jgi:plasmid maintenance system antidote protein VapI
MSGSKSPAFQGFDRPRWSQCLVNGKSGISAEMAIRLDKAFGGGAETWLRLQAAHDLAQARRQAREIDVERVPRERLREPSST